LCSPKEYSPTHQGDRKDRPYKIANYHEVKNMNLLIKGGRVIDPSQCIDDTLDVIVETVW